MAWNKPTDITKPISYQLLGFLRKERSSLTKSSPEHSFTNCCARKSNWRTAQTIALCQIFIFSVHSSMSFELHNPNIPQFEHSPHFLNLHVKYEWVSAHGQSSLENSSSGAQSQAPTSGPIPAAGVWLLKAAHCRNLPGSFAQCSVYFCTQLSVFIFCFCFCF